MAISNYVLSIAALAASVLLLVTPHARIPAVFAALASGLEVLMAAGVIRVAVSGVPLILVLGAVILVAGVVAYLRVTAKGAVSAATVATLVGLAQVLRSLHAI
jgi:hypothetical protein